MAQRSSSTCRRGWWLSGISALGMSLLVLGCSPGYVMRAAYEQSKILLNRQSIERVIADPETPGDDREKLKLVLEARLFATTMGLNPGGSFTSYAAVSRDPLAWVVVASRRDAFALRTWWFPIVGRVPYKGFFERSDADEEVKELESAGYEGSIRGTEAFSTLGWFDDPVVSTTLKHSAARIANTVIHETVHSTAWIPGSVAFNESVANFVGSMGAVSFFKARLEECRTGAQPCQSAEQSLAAAQKDYAAQFELGSLVDSLYTALDTLYRDPKLTTEEKIARRVEVFNEITAPYRARFPSLSILKGVNNADIIQMKLYLTKIPLFLDLFIKRGGDWREFMATIKEVQNQLEREPSKDPFNVLEDIVRSSS